MRRAALLALALAACGVKAPPRPPVRELPPVATPKPFPSPPEGERAGVRGTESTPTPTSPTPTTPPAPASP